MQTNNKQRREWTEYTAQHSTHKKLMRLSYAWENPQQNNENGTEMKKENNNR